MMNSTPSNLGAKSLSVSNTKSTLSPPVAVPSPSFEASVRRSAAPSPSVAIAAPRKGQASRKQHRDKRRPVRESRFDDDYDMDQIRAMRNATDRRGQTSITHLLNNYRVPTRQYLNQVQGYGHGNSRPARRHPTWGPGSGYHPIDKANFVHANYRFVVAPYGDYSAQAHDADKHLDWNDVLQIIASSESQSTSCPICLSDPIAPRMARCGHVFCLSCLIRFMHSTDDDEPAARKETRWKKCPICEDHFRMADTRPVRFYAGQESPLPRPGDDVVLRLMFRDHGSTIALPKEGGVDVVNLGEEIPWHFAANVMDYSRIMKGTDDYMLAQHDREIEDLRKQAVDDEIQFGVDDGDWIQRAIRAIETQKEKIREPKPTGDTDAANESANGSSKVQSKQPAGQTFYFYSSPPHIYLAPLDIRILKTKYGDFSNFPTTLLPRVEHISTGHVVDDALRRRAKYLGHLPHGCVINIVECDWTDIVPPEILDTFKGELERRRKVHRDKAAQEERERLQAERLEAAAIGRGARRQFEQNQEPPYEPQPTLSAEDFQPLAPVEGTSPPNPRPGFEPLAEMSTSPSASKTVWGTRAIAGSPDLAHTPAPAADDGWLKEDDFLSAAEMRFQMEALGIDGASPGPSSSGGGGGGGHGSGKKKKKQKITLMSTGSRRGN